ncbi:hypothetical protein ACX80L_17695, partial [Arthrobacter sp. MDT1-48-3]
YQQTWHTIEFSNNRSYRHQTRPNRHVLAPKQLFKLTPAGPISQIHSPVSRCPLQGQHSDRRRTSTTDDEPEADSNIVHRTR